MKDRRCLASKRVRIKMTNNNKHSTVNVGWAIVMSCLIMVLCYTGWGDNVVVAQEASCTSMDGPYCSFVNGKSLPSHLGPETFADKGILGELLGGAGGSVDAPPIAQEVQKLVNGLMQQIKEQQIPSLKPQSASAYPQVDSGSFKIDGFALSEMNFVQLFPRQWINQPGDNWIRVGLRGGFQEKNLRLYSSPDTPFQMTSSMLVFSLMDEKPSKRGILDQCSKVLLVRTRKGLRRHVLDGVWRGRYSCGGSRTALKLVIITSDKRTKKNSPSNRPQQVTKVVKSALSVKKNPMRTTQWLASKNREVSLRGTFNFVAETFPGRDSTLAGCKCVFEWSYEGVNVSDGKCGKPEVGADKPWCFIEQGTCTRSPAGVNWDYCEEKKDQEEEFQIQFVFNQEGDFFPA